MSKSVLGIAAVLLVGCGPSVPDMSIHEAAFKKDIDAIKKLLATGVDVNAKDDYRETPLHYASLLGCKETADLLRKHGGKTYAELKAEGK